MVWPFRRPKQDAEEHLPSTAHRIGDPMAHHQVVTDLLKEAHRQAQSLASGATFSVNIDDPKAHGMVDIHEVGPIVIARAQDYGLHMFLANRVDDMTWRFSFQKMPPNEDILVDEAEVDRELFVVVRPKNRPTSAP